MTTFTPPAELLSNPSGLYYSASVKWYKRYSAHASDSATKKYYTLFENNGTTANAVHAVYFDTNTLQWVDGSTGHPSIIDQPATLSNGSTVSFKKPDGTIVYQFDMEGFSSSATFGGTTEIPFTGSSQWAQTGTLYKYKLDTSQTTSTSVFFELFDLRVGQPSYNQFISPAEYGMEIRYDTSTGNTVLYLNTSNNSLDPKYFGDSNGNNLVQSKVITSNDVGTTIHCWRSGGIQNNASFTVVSGMLWSSGSGSGINPLSQSSSSDSDDDPPPKVFHNFW